MTISTKKPFEIIKIEPLYKGFFSANRYSVRHERYDGSQSRIYTREIFERGRAVAVLLYDPHQDQVVLVEQFRVGAIHSDNPWLVELVAGMIDEGQTPESVAIREAEEESGAKIGQLHFIADYYSSVGGSPETTHLYYAEIDASQVEGIHGLVEEDEDILVVKMTAKTFLKQLYNNEFRSASLITAGFWFQNYLNQKA